MIHYDASTKCSSSTPCSEGEGDCDYDYDCKPGLKCGQRDLDTTDSTWGLVDYPEEIRYFTCSNDFFGGDPLPGEYKYCWCGGIKCANEGARCDCLSGTTVYYGTKTPDPNVRYSDGPLDSSKNYYTSNAIVKVGYLDYCYNPATSITITQNSMCGTNGCA